MASKFHQTLYAKIENEGGEDQYLETSDKVEELAEIGEVVTIAEYKLVRKHKVRISVNLEALNKRGTEEEATKMMIFGSDGVEMIEKRLREQLFSEPERKTFLVAASSLRALIAYYKKLTDLCDHEWDVTSPVDSVALCMNCGRLKSI
jgi:hypothetical protein